jgi:hypothetical protein
MTFPRGMIKAYREYLNEQHGYNTDGGQYINKHSPGARTRLYGDYLYSQDREMFIVSMMEDVENGTFKFDNARQPG